MPRCSHPRDAGQVRWATTLARVLGLHKRLLRLELPWRPLLLLMQRTHLLRSAGYEGGATGSAHVAALERLVRRARRFFPAGAAAELLQELRPGFADLGTADPMLALGWLGLFLPAPAIAWDASVDWAALAAALVALLPAVPGCPYWSSALLSSLARLRKHDVACRVPWDEHVAPLFTHLLSCFELPIGSAAEVRPF